MSFSIYDLDEHIRELLNLNNFLGGLSVNEFIEELSKDHSLKGAEVNKLEYLDPKPYIRTFESTLRELKRLTDESEKRKAQSERDVESFELKHSQNVLELSSKVDNITKKFSDLDTNISDVSSKIDPLGQSLNKISNSRDRSTETIFLIRAYHGFFTKSKYDPLEKLRTSKKYEDKVKCAKTVNNLLTLAKKIISSDIPKTLQCVTVIEKFGETMERDLLKKFDVYYESDEYERMREVASILHQYNGGSTVIQLFVNKHDFMMDIENLDDNSIIDNETVWQNLSDPSYTESLKDETTEALLDRLRMSIKGQARIVQQVFEDPTPVLKFFIQRIYAQIIQNKVSMYLQYSLSVSALAHVRVLHTLYVLVGDFTKDVREFLTTNDLDKENELAGIIDQCYYDLFIEYTSENYFSREKKNLEDLVYNLAHKFNLYHEKALSNQALATKLENMDNIETADKTMTESQDRSGFSFIEKKRLNQFTSFMKSKIAERSSRNSADLEKNTADYEENATLNLSKVEVVIKSVIESVARVLELSPLKAPEYSLEILEILLFDFGKLYINGGLEVSYDTLKQESANSKVHSTQLLDFSYLSSFNLVSEILYLLSSCIKKIILPCAVNTPNIKGRMINLTNRYVRRCEISLNIIILDTIKLITARIAFLLNKQKKKDFLCDNIVEDDTEACEEVSQFLTYCHGNLCLYLRGPNLNNVLVKVGMSFLNQLLEHYKKFIVNSTGGIILTKDVIRFQSVIDQWEISELSEKFTLLKEIGNLFTVHPNLINSLVAEGQLANLKPYSIRQYISKRSDFNPSYLERFFNFK